MISSFKEIVEEIIIQSRYYPTNLYGNDPDFGGYITFEDQIGEYMEVKDVKGILLGDTLFSGAMLASKFVLNSDGTVTTADPELTKEIIGSVSARIGIDYSEAVELINKAGNDNQLYYNSDDDYGNCITWYANSDGSFLAFADSDDAEPNVDAVYINRSYGFLGKSTGNIKDSDMMYMSVHVQTNISSGHQTVYWKIPAALVPMVTYSITLKGDSVENATDIKLDIQNAEPIRLVFEVGLRSEINELNVSAVMAAAGSKFKTVDGYYFWTNRWNDFETGEGSSHENDTATTVNFHPSTENERYYFVEDTDIYVSDGNGGYSKVRYSDESGFDSNTQYYRFKTIFTQIDEETLEAEKSTFAEELTAGALAEKKQRDDGTWYIPRGTVSHFFDDFSQTKSENITESLEYAADPFVKLTSTSYDAYTLHGNNGRLKVTPAQGIMLSKQLDVTQPDTDTEFKFVIELDAPAGVALAEQFPYVVADIGEYEGTEGVATVNNGKIEITLSAGKVVYITDLPTGTEYTVAETDENDDYYLKTASVNGVYSETGIASGKITAYTLDAVEFVNTPVIKGSLIIDKTVTHPFGADYSIPDGIEFDITVTLNGKKVSDLELEASTANGTTTVNSDENGVISLKLKHGEAISIHGIPEGTEYTVEEINIPDGFTLTSQSSGLTGTISKDANATVSLVNNYVPAPVTPNVEVNVSKLLSGRDFKEGDSFEFVLERYSEISRASYIKVDSVRANAMADVENGELKATFDMSQERLTEAGVYYYYIYETDDSLAGNGIAGVTYDSSRLQFTVTVTDSDMDGRLEISAVTPVAPVTVSGNAEDGFTVSGSFNNSYKANVPATISIDITKYINDPAGSGIGRNGFSFALYDSNLELVATSNLTDTNGKASITMTYSADLIGESYTYTLKELVHETAIPGMTYSEEERTFTVDIIDNGDGTVGTLINGFAADGYVTNFTNTYDPADAVLIISGAKELTGRVVNENEFSFKLYETGEDYAIADLTPETATNSANGEFVFDAIEYETAGDRYYVITEADNGVKSITYDTTVYRIHVSVTDNGEGALIASADITKADGSSAETVVFANIYNALTVKVELNVNKTVDSKQEKTVGAEGFNFIFTRNGATAFEVATDKNGKATFELNFTEADAGNTYTYIMSEVNGGLAGITYDKSEYKFEITVDYDSEGNLIATVTKDGSTENAYTADFVNIYEVIEAGDSTSFISWIALLFISGGAAITLFTNGKKKRRSF